VSLIAEGKAPKIPQPEEGASYEPMLNKKESSMVRLDELTGQQLHNFIRGCDKVPGAWITLDEQEVKLYGSKQWTQDIPNGSEIKVLGIDKFFLLLKFPDLKKMFHNLI
jgi:formyltetrahydrofolate dehydrogenase